MFAQIRRSRPCGNPRRTRGVFVLGGGVAVFACRQPRFLGIIAAVLEYWIMPRSVRSVGLFCLSVLGSVIPLVSPDAAWADTTPASTNAQSSPTPHYGQDGNSTKPDGHSRGDPGRKPAGDHPRRRGRPATAHRCHPDSGSSGGCPGRPGGGPSCVREWRLCPRRDPVPCRVGPGAVRCRSIRTGDDTGSRGEACRGV